MKFKEIGPIVDENHIPHAVLMCLSCSLMGTELTEIFPEGENQQYTEKQLEDLNKLAEVHGRRHTNPRINLYIYERS